MSADRKGRGKGSTFTVSFPLLIARGREPVHEQSSDATRLKTTQATDLSGLLVMIVDDESDAREVITAMLERCGAGVIAACSTAEAIDILAGATNGSMPHVLVSDIGMPGEDGIDLIKKVRELAPERGGSIPAIALTAYARAEDRARVWEAGYQRHIAKPVEPATLASVVAVLARQTAFAAVVR